MQICNAGLLPAICYNFDTSEHLECRVFVKQKGGVVSVKEKHPCNKKLRRRIQVTGLKDATVCFFPEEYAKNDLFVGTETVMDFDPEEFKGFVRVTDEFGTYYKCDHVSGDLVFSMPFKEYIK